MGRPIEYLQLPLDQFHPTLAQQLEGFMRSGGFRADVAALRARWPGLLRLEDWLYKSHWDRIDQLELLQ